MEEQYMSLITEYMDGTLTPEREREFQEYIQQGHIDVKEVEALMVMQKNLIGIKVPEPSAALRESFYQKLAEAGKTIEKNEKAPWAERINAWLFGQVYGKLAFGVLILVIGLWIGKSIGADPYQNQLTALNSQITEMREMMMMSMLEKESVTDRLKGVQMSSELSSSNQKVIDALFVTLNKDRSTNVRMAALNTLAQYANEPQIREGLVNSIRQQQSPLMQVALAELMVELQEQKAIDQFKPILENEFTPEEVKTTLQASIEKIM